MCLAVGPQSGGAPLVRNPGSSEEEAGLPQPGAVVPPGTATQPAHIGAHVHQAVGSKMRGPQLLRMSWLPIEGVSVVGVGRGSHTNAFSVVVKRWFLSGQGAIETHGRFAQPQPRGPGSPAAVLGGAAAGRKP